jgi:hypothetical protein
MTTGEHYLRSIQEPVPRWLDDLRAEGCPDPSQLAAAFLSSRVVFYPGSGTDGQPVKLFGSTHSAHCFVYADDGVLQERLEGAIDYRPFRGYRSLKRVALEEEHLVPNGWRPHVSADELRRMAQHYRQHGRIADRPFGFLQVLQRNDDLDDGHGASRLAILFLGADAVAAFDALFCQVEGRAPFALVVQDHGFGGNYSSFGGDGLLAKVAGRAGCFPAHLLVAQGHREWAGYTALPDGRMINDGRFLPRRLFISSSSDVRSA